MGTPGKFVVQFSHAGAYTPHLLRALNDICRESSDWLEVRFYGHYGSSFDAAVLRELPDVKTLSLDCLNNILNEDVLLGLQRLSALHFGVFEFDRPDLLERLDLRRLTSLTLSENRKRNLDLTPLSKCSSLERLFVQGHSRGIDAIARLCNLKEVTLGSFAKVQSIAFLRVLPALEKLTLILGGRDTIDEFSSKTLQTLQILRVRGFQSLGDLSRFPCLRNLRIEDQLQLKSVDLTGAQLERLSLFNCKELARLVGLEHQARLRDFHSAKVALNSDYLRDFPWPVTTKAVKIFSGSFKWNELTAKILTERGYSQSFQDWR